MTRVTQQHIDARTGSIQGAALVAFARRGVERTTMQEIATEAGLSAGAIYRYFPGKTNLLHSVFETARRDNEQAFADASAASSSPLEALMRVGRTALGEGTADHGCIELEFTLAGVRDPAGVGVSHRALRNSVIEQVERLVRDAQASGEIAADLDPAALALAGYALVAGLRMFALEAVRPASEAAALDVFGELLRRSGATPAPDDSTDGC